MKILVTGGTGNVGGAVTRELLKRGAQVRVLSRKKPEEGKLPANVEIAIGDLLDPVSLEKAVEGIDKLFLVNAVVADELTQALTAYGVAKQKVIRHRTAAIPDDSSRRSQSCSHSGSARQKSEPSSLF